MPQPSKTGTTSPEHFYFIEKKGSGKVRRNTGNLPVSPGSLVPS